MRRTNPDREVAIRRYTLNRSHFLRGAARLLDLGAGLDRHCARQQGPAVTDSERLASDWYWVGQDVWAAAHRAGEATGIGVDHALQGAAEE